MMEPIPDHSIQSPFGRLSVDAIKNDDRFNKYRAHIVPWFQEHYDKYMYSTSGFTCDVCKSWLSNTKSGRVLGHFASIKHLKAAGILDPDDRKRRRVCYKHTVNASGGIVDGVVTDVSSGFSK